MLADLWFTYLYQPVFNLLVWIYTGIAGNNMGWAVVWLTVFLRVALLPLNLISARDAVRQEKVKEQAKESAKAYKGDPLAQRDQVRQIMQKNSVSPWAKALSLAVQLLVLVLLYQVFLNGITGEKMIKILYSSVNFPGAINTNFYGFDIGAERSLFWSAITGLYLFISIWLSNRKEARDSAKTTYMFLFPIAVFAVLWFLPIVKALFVLTSMVFSDTVLRLIKALFPYKPKEKSA